MAKEIGMKWKRGQECLPTCFLVQTHCCENGKLHTLNAKKKSMETRHFKQRNAQICATEIFLQTLVEKKKTNYPKFQDTNVRRSLSARRSVQQWLPLSPCHCLLSVPRGRRPGYITKQRSMTSPYEQWKKMATEQSNQSTFCSAESTELRQLRSASCS